MGSFGGGDSSNESMMSVRRWGALVALSHAEEQLALAFALGTSTTNTTTTDHIRNSNGSGGGDVFGGGGGSGSDGGDVDASQRRWLREWTRLCCLGDLHGKVGGWTIPAIPYYRWMGHTHGCLALLSGGLHGKVLDIS